MALQDTASQSTSPIAIALRAMSAPFFPPWCPVAVYETILSPVQSLYNC